MEGAEAQPIPAVGLRSRWRWVQGTSPSQACHHLDSLEWPIYGAVVTLQWVPAPGRIEDVTLHRVCYETRPVMDPLVSGRYPPRPFLRLLTNGFGLLFRSPSPGAFAIFSASGAGAIVPADVEGSDIEADRIGTRAGTS
jgi:hypothetical protein